MSAPQHTPGPWLVQDEDVTNGAGDMVAGVFTGGYTRNGDFDRQRLKANAHLIAAAPDMLATLEALVGSFEKHRPKEYWDAARAAIAKAKGKA